MSIRVEDVDEDEEWWERKFWKLMFVNLFIFWYFLLFLDIFEEFFCFKILFDRFIDFVVILMLFIYVMFFLIFLLMFYVVV